MKTDLSPVYRIGAKPATVVLIRHAQSEWNRAGLFTGWADPELTEDGRREAERAAALIAAAGIQFGQVYSSRLRRAHHTAEIIVRLSQSRSLAILNDWRLNERHYGALQGRNKQDMIERVGEKQVWRWRRGFLDLPPILSVNDPAHPLSDPRWSDIAAESLPGGESLAMTRARVMDFWQAQIQPQLMSSQTILISSHGNTLRALLMALDGMSVSQVEALEIPTGLPIVYRFSPDGEPRGWEYLSGSSPQAA